MAHDFMPSNPIVRYAIPVTLVIVSLVGLPSRLWGEVYPLAPWDMYSKIPAHTTVHVLKIHRLGKTDIEPPQIAQNIPSISRTFRSPTSKTVINKFGYAFDSAKKGAAESRQLALTLRKTLETRLPKGSIYEVVRLSGNPLEGYRKGRFENERSLGAFQCGGEELQEFDLSTLKKADE